MALPEAIRIPPELEIAAAAKLLGESHSGRGAAGRRMLTAAALHGIDLTLMWGTVERNRNGRPVRVRQVCLAVPGAGRTAMCVLSKPTGRREAHIDHLERIAASKAACDGLAQLNRTGAMDIRLAQALPEPRDEWAISAFDAAGFSGVGQLAYLRLPAGQITPQPEPTWPPGLEIRTVFGAGPGEPDREALITALDRSYTDTLDCPELCGLRETRDILDSHRATGTFDPRLWWIIFSDGQPHGCMLFSHVPDHHCVELVYLGLSPALRGKGLGKTLLRMGLGRLRSIDADHVACAVDLRNTPARKLYEQVGFREFGRRVALVKAIPGNAG